MTTRLNHGHKIIKWDKSTFAGFQNSSIPVSNTSTDVKSGGSVPGYKEKIRTGTNATGGYNREILTQELVRGNAEFSVLDIVTDGQRKFCRLSGVCLSNPLPIAPNLPSNNADSQARINFVQKVRSSRRKFESGTALGELKETIRMISSPAKALRRAVSTYSSAANKGYRRAKNVKVGLKTVSGLWLEHSYGWRPLFADVDNAMKALAGVPRLIGEVISGSSSDQTKVAPFTTIEDFSGGRLRVSWTEMSTTRVRYKGLVAYENDNPSSDWRSNWGLTLSDFLPTVWNLFPYSFLVDYFSNVGKVIDSASMGTVSLRWGCRSSFTRGERILISAKVDNSGGNYPAQWQFKAGTAVLPAPNLSRIHFNRQGIGGVQVGLSDISLKVPGIGDWRKWANITALGIEKSL